MPVDPKLVEIARSAERSGTLPMLRLSTPGQLIVGTPGPSSKYNEATWDAMVREIEASLRREYGVAFTQKSKERKEAEATERYEAALAGLREGWGPAALAPEPDPPDHLTMYAAIVWAWGENSGVRVPALRVRLDSISSWWPTQSEVIQGKTSGGWFAFVSFPLPGT